MDYDEVQTAVASETLFINSRFKNQGGGNIHARGAALPSSPALLFLGESSDPEEKCELKCGVPGASNVCDRSCSASGERGARFGGHLCGAGDASKYGPNCRKCYESLQEAQAAEEALAVEEKLAVEHGGNYLGARGPLHVIACDTLLPPPPPPPATSCSPKCQMKPDTVRGPE